MLDFDVRGCRLRVIGISETGDISLSEFKESKKRLVLAVPVGLILDDGVALHACMRSALGERGLVAPFRTGNLAALATDLAMPADVAASWLEQSDVTVAVLGAPAELVAAVVLAAELPVGAALDVVRGRVPDALVGAEEEIAVSVAKDHMVLRRDLQRRRLEWVAQGGSAWDIR